MFDNWYNDIERNPLSAMCKHIIYETLQNVVSENKLKQMWKEFSYTDVFEKRIMDNRRII